MRIKWTRLYVDDQEKALRFYTDNLGFQKKTDFSNGTSTTGSVIAVLDDSCGNLIQLTQLTWG